MKKIVIFYPHINEYGGIERNILGLSEVIRQRGYRPLLLCFADHVSMADYDQHLQVEELGNHWSPYNRAFRVARWLKNNSPDFHGRPFFFGGNAGYYAAIKKGSEYILHYTDPPSLLTKPAKMKSPLKRCLMALRRYIFDSFTKSGVDKAAVRLTMTKWNAEELESLYGHHFDVIYQGGVPPKGIIRKTPRCFSSTLNLFSICRLTSSKNLNWILEATKKLKTNKKYRCLCNKIRVVIAGKGPEGESLIKMAKILGINEVSFPGFLTNEEVEQEYSKADLVLVPGRQGYGLPALEALYRRVPVILNKESRVSEILDKNPWVSISENDFESFAEKVQEHLLNIRAEYPSTNLLNGLPTESTWGMKLEDDVVGGNSTLVDNNNPSVYSLVSI